MGAVKTTFELPEQLFRKAKATAAERGQTLKEFVTEALRDKLTLPKGPGNSSQPEWMEGFGKLKDKVGGAVKDLGDRIKK